MWPILALWSATLTGCDVFGLAGPPSEPPFMSGVITSAPVQEPPFRILIEEKPGVWDDSLDPGRKAYVTVEDGTDIFVEQSGGSWRRGAPEDLQVSALAKVWITGVGIDTSPMQVRASAIGVMRSASH